jgi:ketosteroid isomerase-like protein
VLEKASVEAWKRRDKAFYADYWANDFTMFLPQNPYLDADAKANSLSKFEQKTEQWKLIDLQIYNPRVQVYGDIAVLTYNEAVEGLSDGRPTSYTGKVTMIYHRQGGKWRGVHYHESENRATR